MFQAVQGSRRLDRAISCHKILLPMAGMHRMDVKRVKMRAIV
jgi:hypothetical protein